MGRVITVRAVALAVPIVLLTAGAAAAHLRAPVRVSLEGVDGVRPGMPTDLVEERWGVSLRPSYELSHDCGPADIRGVPGVDGYAVFMPHDRFGAVFLSRGAVTGRGIHIGSKLAQLRRAYRGLTSAPNRFGGRYWFARRTASPRWELRFDVADGSVQRIVFGTRKAVRLDEACA